MKREKFTILVVDDEPNDQFFIQRAFKKAGVLAPIQFANNAKEAIAYLNGEGKYADRNTYEFPSFVLTDLKMPLSDGFAVLEYLQHRPHLRIIPTVVLSASKDPDDVRRAYQLGASCYVVKPGEFSELQKVLKILLDFWLLCEVPLVDSAGKHLKTEGKGKLGERFSVESSFKDQAFA